MSGYTTEPGYQPSPASARVPYLPGLDGLRALAVIAVLLYHAGVIWLPGGFLGVEAFFVISGYLITALLLTEWRAHGRLDLKAFWLRRARRLLPALFLVLAATLAIFVALHPGEVATVRGDALAALGYVTNWYYILRQQSYFEVIGRPSPLLHLWSLAIEEQFYLLWPPLLLLLLRWWGARLALVGALAGAAGAAILMALLYHPGADPSRVYYGTDTRATGLLLGAALACVWAPWRDQGQATRRRALLLDGAGFGALALLIGLFLVLDEFQPLLYRGGFVLVAAATTATIAVAVSPRSRLFPALLEWAPLRWVGMRSYGIYLWHWPVFVLTRPQIDLPLDGPALLAVRLAATVALAALSYHFVEMPVRAGALERAWRAVYTPRDVQARRRVALGSGFVGMSVGLLLALSVAVAGARPPAPPAELAAGSVALTVPTRLPELATPVAESTAVATQPGDDATPTETPLALVAHAAATPVDCSAGRLTSVAAIGDSVLVGASSNLAATIGEGFSVNATVGRQPWDMPALLREWRQTSQFGDIMVIHVGNNGYLTDDNFDAIMKELAEVKVVIFVNVRVPRAWERGTNSALAEGVERYQNAYLIDWHGESDGHPEYFREDGVHLTVEGREVFATLVAKQVEVARAREAEKPRCSPGADASQTPPAAPDPRENDASSP